ncbi:signal transduction histidine kinase [Paenibacillus sp. JGP012]|uniref:sensor histidine kinase n=1 Tax=Paenibacillus sp. JGP012 TaxID=2735914 RepID=UPI00160A8476|nr:ATP-binding protein [Paenibacillus sp. JGP012]MBB6019521.1 signal transduction histidine kinase [Paenibacillus sp. JGP012]
MEETKFTIEDRELAELLGRQNFSNKESAVFELMKNCYDAGSAVCDIYINSNFIRIIDYGDGMNYEDVQNKWLHVGKSTKGYKRKGEDRVFTGSKGVGRFALARLGNKARVTSKVEGGVAVLWETNWNYSNLATTKVDFEKGTTIEILELRDKWRENDINNLVDFFKRAYKSKEMSVTVYFEGKAHIIKPIFENLKKGENYSTKIKLEYNNKRMELTVDIDSDEFKQEVVELISPISPKKYFNKFNMEEEFGSSIEDVKLYLSEIGSFSAELYFALDKVPVESFEKYMYKYNNLSHDGTGIILNRNNFSISSLEGKKDWLDIASRALKSPAAATHRTGSWRIRKNQIFGEVVIDKEENKNLKDMANRQGLEEDEYYEVFRYIILFGISKFERYRQDIIRQIDGIQNEAKKDKDEEKKKLREFLKKPSRAIGMSNEELSHLAEEIKDIQREVKEKAKEHKENEQQFKYDVRILNVLATQGLRASSISHELHNKRNILESGYKDVVNALEEFGFWEELNSEEYTRISYKNVPLTLSNLEEVNKRLIAFLDVILNKIEKEKFNSKIDSIEGALNTIVKTWIKEYDWLTINVISKNEVQNKYKISSDVLDVIFDNLILNSIQHNEMKDKLTITIEVDSSNGFLQFKYNDNGTGLNKKYIKDPKRILEVHETSRRDGHGLGMWIVNNTLHMYGGNVIEIRSDNGFHIYFNLKG